MKGKTFNLILVVLILLIVISGFIIVNTAISLKYETNNSLISKVAGENLYYTQKIWQALNLFFAVCIILMLVFKSKIIKGGK